MKSDYEIRIWYSSDPGDECYVAQVAEMAGVMAHGATREEALGEVEAALHLALEVYRENGERPPAPKNQAAVLLGRKGGERTSRAKKLAAIANGKQGGRPRNALRVTHDRGFAASPTAADFHHSKSIARGDKRSPIKRAV